MRCVVALLFVASLAGFVLAEEANPRVLLGIDVLRRDGFDAIAGKRVGLITNHTGIDGQGVSTIDALAAAEQVELVRLFGPEHGLRGELDQAMVKDGVDEKTGLPVISLYGPRRRPTAEQLADLDALVFDIQDIGCRFYTYISTMKLAMAAAAESNIEFFVLDRPNPIGGVSVAGPMLDTGAESFVGCHALPVRHGMTIGELAMMFHAEDKLELDLHIVRCEGWRRGQHWDDTGLLWTDPSPNMRRITAALLYPGIGLLETTNVSVGRGTDTPFELFGAPWIDPWRLQAALEAEDLAGVRFVPRFFTPSASEFAGERCGGVDLIIADRKKLRPVEVGLAIAATLRQMYPDEWNSEQFPRLLGNQACFEALQKGQSAAALAALARQGLSDFESRRGKYLLYD